MTSKTLKAAALGSIAALATIASPGFAASIQNGSFSDGFSGYDVYRCTIFCGNDGTNSAEIVNGAGDDPYLELRAPSYVFGPGQIEVRQQVQIDAGMSDLSFDVGLLAYEDTDIQRGIGNTVEDYFTLLMQTSTNFYSLFTYDVNGAREAASNTLPGLSVSPTIMPNLPGAISAYSFGADLSAFAGETVTFFFTTVSKDDGHLTQFGVDNIELTGAPISPVPLPAGGVLMFASLALLGGLRMRRSEIRIA